MIAHCRTQLTSYKLPRHVEFRDALPKTPIGKVLRRELRDAPKAYGPAQTGMPPRGGSCRIRGIVPWHATDRWHREEETEHPQPGAPGRIEDERSSG